MKELTYKPRNTGKSRAGTCPSKFSQEQEARIFKLNKRDGLTVVEIAEMYSSSVKTIRKAIKAQSEREQS